MRTLLALALLTASCAQKQADQSAPHVLGSFSSEVMAAQGVAAPKGRLFYTHGFYQNTAVLKTDANYRIIPDALTAAGYEVILIGWPAVEASDFADGGLAYVASFQAYVLSVAASLDPVPVTITGGTSFGGLHAVWMAEALGAQITFSNLSVTEVSALAEFRSVDTRAVDIEHRTLPAHFWISYGTQDTRVSGDLTLNLFRGFPELHSYNCAHTAQAQQMNDILSWLSSLGIN